MKFVLRAVQYDIIKLKPGGKLSGGDILKLSELFARQFEVDRQRYSRQAAL
jgi:hypothetical protein